MCLDKYLDWFKLQEIASRDLPLAHCTYYYDFFNRTVDQDCELDWYEITSCKQRQEVNEFWMSDDDARKMRIYLKGEVDVEFHLNRTGASDNEPNAIRLMLDFFVDTQVIRNDLGFAYEKEFFEENMAINLP